MSDDSRRVQRVTKELNHLISAYLRSEWKGPSPGLLSVVQVDVATDLRTAKVFVSVISAENQAPELCEELLAEQRGEIQRYISKNLRMKYYPKLSFKVGTYGASPVAIDEAEEN